MSISIAPVKRSFVTYPAGGATLTLPIPDSQHYTRFVFQLKGFTVGTQITLQGSVDGQNWAPLDAASTFISVPYTTTAAGVVIALDTYAPLPGGLRFVLAGASVAAGDIFASMTASPYNTNRA